MTRSAASSKDVQGDQDLTKVEDNPKTQTNISNSENGWEKESGVHNLILTGKNS
jgi:hypothetical protein